MTRNEKLNELFVRWRRRYPVELRAGFHPDGIVDEAVYLRQREQIAYVLAEPNSTAGRYGKHKGSDLREVFGHREWTKAINVNVARWTNCILDGEKRAPRMNGKQADASNRRVAIMNLKKLSGGGTADKAAISIDAWNRRNLILSQIQIMAPTVIVACGALVNRLLYRIVANNEFADAPSDEHWNLGACIVIPSHHPSLRNATQARNALDRIRRMGKRARIGAFRQG